MTPPSDDRDHERMLRHVAAQDDGYASGSFDIEKRSGLYLRSRIFKELFALFCLLEDDNPGFKLTRVLEVGCGLGNISPSLRACADSVLSIDLSEAAVTEARRRNAGLSGLEYLVYDGTRPKDSEAISGHRYDLIYVREFHPFSRDLYGSKEEAYLSHGNICRQYIDLLTDAGYLVISQMSREQQSIETRSIISPKADLIINAIDPRLLTILLVLTRNRVRLSLRLTWILQPIFHMVFRKSILYVLKKKPSQADG